jgi:hypothetical protein
MDSSPSGKLQLVAELMTIAVPQGSSDLECGDNCRLLLVLLPCLPSTCWSA